MKIILDTRRAH